MFQWRFDNYGAIRLLLFFAREVYILNLKSPGVTKDLREEKASFRKVRSFAMDKGCDTTGLNVSKMVLQLRCDKFVLFSARQLCIMELEVKPASYSQGNWHLTQGR